MTNLDFAKAANLVSRLLEGYLSAAAVQSAVQESMEELFEMLGELGKEVESYELAVSERLAARKKFTLAEGFALVAASQMATAVQDFYAGRREAIEMVELAERQDADVEEATQHANAYMNEIRQQLYHRCWEFRVASNVEDSVE